MPIYKFEEFIPVIDESAYVHPLAVVLGSVVIGKSVYIGPGAVLRGDFGTIRVGDGSNIQENCVVHMFPGVTVTFEEDSHIGHGSIIHGATIKKNALIGMNSVIMDNAIIGEESIVGALSFVPTDFEVPPRTVAVGNPVKLIKDVDDETIHWKTEGTKIYQSLPKRYAETHEEVTPLRKEPANYRELLKKRSDSYKTLRQTKSEKK